MYNPEYDFLSPGVLGAVREIEYVNKIRKMHDESMKYYYMGFYIQDCQKSVYKGEYHPSDLLCPVTYTWVQLDKVKAKIDSEGYWQYAEDGTEVIDDMVISDELYDTKFKQKCSFCKIMFN